MLDLDGSTAVADAAGAWRFVNPCTGRTLDDVPGDVPHAFDTADDSDASRAVIRQLLEFLRETLSAQD
jgi:hypothetical protein